MSSESSGGVLHSVYRNRIGRPTTADEVRGYWMFIVGLLFGVVGIVAFLPSESAVGTSGITIREISIVLAAVGLALLVAGFVVRLPLQSWANYAAYLGLLLCVAAAAWFTTVFPADWSVQTGNQPVIILYAAGLALITLGGVLAPLLVGVTKEDLEASERKAEQLRRELESVKSEREDLKSRLQSAQQEGSAGEAERAELEEEIERLESERDDLQERLEAARAEVSEGETARAALADSGEEMEAELASLRNSQAQFELYEDKGGKYRWRLRHRNGNVIATSGQGYTRKHNAQKGLASVKRNSLGGGVLHVEPDPEEDPEEALEAAPVLPDEAEHSDAEFEVYEDEGGKYRWRLVHENGNVVADSGEGYSSKRNARAGVESVKNNADAADYLRFDPTSFEIYRDAAGEWRWRLVHKNGNILAAASEGYSRRRNAKRSVDSLRENVADADGFEVYEDNAGEYRWRFRAANNEVVATGGEGYASKSGAEDAVERIRNYAPEADALDVGFAAFEVYRDAAEEWRWRLRHRNGNVIADGGEGYASRTGVHDAIEGVKTNAPGATVTEA